MLVYWDLTALWNLLADYLLLLSSARLAGVGVARLRLFLGAAVGAAYAAAQLFLPHSPLLLGAAFALLCAVSFYGTGRALRLSLLFALLCCAFGGIVLLLGGFVGMERLRRGLFFGELPWGVFFAAAGLSYLLLCVIFRGAARYKKTDFAEASVTMHGETVTLRLLCDSGNTLRDPASGAPIPIVESVALEPLHLIAEELWQEIPYTAVGVGEGRLKAFRCDTLTIDGEARGASLVAVSPTPLGADFRGLWCVEERKA